MDIGADYETITMPCHSCGEVNLYNRATDLRDLGKVVGKEFPCFTCGKPVRISIEYGNPPYEMFIFDCYTFRAERRYMLAVSTLAQALEMFFALGVEILLFHHVRNADKDVTDEELGGLGDELFESTKTYTYFRMRNLLLNCAVQRLRPTSLAEARAVIARIPSLSDEPSDSTLEAVTDSALKPLLVRLKALPIGTLRNWVIHKHAYRPNLDELNECLDPAHELTSQIWMHLKLSESLRGWDGV